jgi:hypothetical protein
MPMTTFTIAILVVSAFVATWGMWQLKKARKQQKINALLAGTLQDLYLSAEAEVRKNKKLIEKAGGLVGDARSVMGMGGADNLMDDPGMLATLVTVMVHKYGDIKLGLADFTSLADDACVSVYVDTLSQDIILSLKRDLDSPSMTSFAAFGEPDDGTYH